MEKFMYCEIESKSSSHMIVPEINILKRDNLNKIKKGLIIGKTRNFRI